MNIDVFKTPIPYIIIDNFLPDIKSTSDLAKQLYSFSVEGEHRREEFLGLKRRELYLEHLPENRQTLGDHLISEFMNTFWSVEMKGMFAKLDYPFPMINAVTNGGFLLGYYDHEDHYEIHHDNSFMTAVLYLHTPKNFTGGDFVLTNQIQTNNFRDEERIVIESTSNRLVIFPSTFLHGVTPILSSVTNDVDSMRIAFSYFMSFHPFN